jgi:hypothetical protein
VAAAEKIEYRRMDVLQRLLGVAAIETPGMIELLDIAAFAEPRGVQIVIIAAE